MLRVILTCCRNSSTCDIPLLDRHVAEQSEHEQRRSHMKAALHAETRAMRVVAFQVGRPCPQDFDETHALQERLRAECTRKLFVIHGRWPTTMPTYKLSDEMGEPINGKFYTQELQSVSPPDRYQIEKIIRSQRGCNGNVRHYVCWWGYPRKFDSWIDEIDVTHQDGGIMQA